MIVKLLLTNLGSMYDKCIHQVQSFGVDGYNILMPAPSVLNVWISLRRTSEMAGFSLLAQIEPHYTHTISWNCSITLLHDNIGINIPIGVIISIIAHLTSLGAQIEVAY